MPASAPEAEWFLARDGRQFGPLTEVELAKFIELGHLQATDLLWREGFPDWRPARLVFPERAASPGGSPGPREVAPAGVAPARSKRQKSQTPELTAESRGSAASGAGPEASARPRRRRGRALYALLFAAAAAGLVAIATGSGALGVLTSLGQRLLAEAQPSGAAAVFPPLSGSPEQIDASLQTSRLWRVVKREFPDFYAERVKGVVRLASENKDPGEAGVFLARALVGLRRENVDNALAASTTKLKALAQTFYENLVELRKHSMDVCFGFISEGEAHPAIVTLLRGSPQAGLLEAHLTGVFESIAEGRRWPRVYAAPRKSDYDLLASELRKVGWTQADFKLFADERALANAGAQKVCQLVSDWFAVQLAIKDSDMQMRLLVYSLRPVVAG
jgi:hypothetical protein